MMIPGNDRELGLSGQSAPRKQLILLICCISLFMNYLDSTILNVALPVLQRTFHADESALQWIVDSFLLVLTCFLVLAGSLADRFGRRRLLIAGLVIFTIGSLGCSLSNSVVQLVFARMITGIGGSMLVPTTLSIVRNTFTERKDLARAIGVWSGVYGLACACGPLVGGILIASTGWRSIFLVNIPVGVIGIILALRFVPESIAEHVRRIDVKGQLLVIAMLGVFVSSIIEAPNFGWISPEILSGFALSVLFLTMFIVVESREIEPLFEIRFFANPAFAGANVLAVLTFVLMSGFLFLNTIYLQQVRDLSAFQAGLFTLPLMIAVAICAPISGRYLAKHGPARQLTYSPFLAMVAFALLYFSHPLSSAEYLFTAYVLLGISLGMVNPTVTHTSVAAMPSSQAGVASAITSTSRQIGSAFGVAILGSVVVTALQSRINAELPSLNLSQAVSSALKRSGIGAMSSPYGEATGIIHAVAANSYFAALRLAWIICFCLCFVWVLVARRIIASDIA